MSAVVTTAAPLLAAAAVVVAALVLVATREVTVAFPVLLDLLLAAGLLRLSAGAPWTAIVSAALIVVVRRLAATGIRRAVTSRRGPVAAAVDAQRPAPRQASTK